MTGKLRETVSPTHWTGRCCGCSGDTSGALRGEDEKLLQPEERKKLLVTQTHLRKRKTRVMVRKDQEGVCVPSPNNCDRIRCTLSTKL